MKMPILRTPLIPFLTPDLHETRIYLKPENLQIFGSYKIRGISQVIADAEPNVLREGIAVASAGNMAQAAAYAAQLLDIPCKVYLPDSAPDVKKKKIVELGAQLVELPYQQVWEIVRNERAPDASGIFIHPAYHQSLLHGYGVIAYEILADIPDVDAIVIPFGVGGLSIGVGAAIKKINPDIAIFTCEPETAAPLHQSLRAGKPSSVQRIPSFVDAIGTPEVLPRVFEILRPMIVDSVVVPLPEIKLALQQVLFKNKLLCEGAAACSLAAALKLANLGGYRKIVCILSGGNVSADIILQANL